MVGRCIAPVEYDTVHRCYSLETAMKLKFLFLMMLASALVCESASALILVEIPNVPGDSTLPGYENLIVAQSTSASFQLNSCDELEVGKRLDKATPLLIAAAVTGLTFPEVKITYLTPSEEGTLNELLTLTLKNVAISSVSSSGSADDLPEEDVALSAQSILVSYTPERGNAVEREVVCKPRRGR